MNALRAVPPAPTFDDKSPLTATISINGEPVEIALHPDHDYCAADRFGNAYIRPAVRPGIPKGMTYPRAAHWVKVKPHPVHCKNTPSYLKFKIGERLFSLHRFIMECWRGIQPKSIVVRHLDGNHLNNVLDNLAYGTVQENVDDAFSHIGNYAEGERNGMAVLTENDVREIRRLYSEGKTPTEIAANYPGITPEAIGIAARRKSWRHVQ